MSLLDEYLKEDSICLMNNNGEEKEFNIIAGISTDNGFYLIMQPVMLPVGMDPGDVMVFEVKAPDGDDDNIEMVTDEEILKEVLDEYYGLSD